MLQMESEEHVTISFFTATIVEWKKLLSPDNYKEINFLLGENTNNIGLLKLQAFGNTYTVNPYKN
jgi:hypothetical protein